MKITILNGNPDPQDEKFEAYLSALTERLEASHHPVTLINLRNLELRSCIGCFGCWVKTPGECITQDDAPQVRQSLINSDFTLFASPLRMGFPSAVLKIMMDKLIPLIHPYAVVDHGEAHHRPRYAHYPRLGLLISEEPDTDGEDTRIVTDIFARTALNMKSRLWFSATTAQPVTQIVDAITKAKGGADLFERNLTPTQGGQIVPPQRLTVFNGSPRGQKGNTPLLLGKFLDGFTSLPGRSFEMFNLNRTHEAEKFPTAFADAECVLLGFPLYTDAMPGIVKAFIEQLAPFSSRSGNPPVGFLVQSGFPEALHSRHVERYLQKLATRLGSPYLSTIVKGGVEGTQSMPDKMTNKMFSSFYQLGKSFAENGKLDPQLLHSLAQPEKYPAYLGPVFKVFLSLPIASFYWDGQLKENGVYEQRNARPYLSQNSH